MEKIFKAGIDIGSTTAKMVVYDNNDNMIFKTYVRHNADIKDTLLSILENLQAMHGDLKLSLSMTGTAGMGVCEKTGISFVQEVIASSTAIRKIYPYGRTLIDIGGEDAKIIVFDDNFKADIRMNGNCAGGTGAFIDQMATLLNVQPSELSTLAEQSTSIYPMASRCGVFAKTDVQTLISRDIPKSDIAKSIFQAVAVQTINTLAKGFEIKPKILFTGGPLTFLPELRRTFLSLLNATEEDMYTVDHPELTAAIGAAFGEKEDQTVIKVSDFTKLVQNISAEVKVTNSKTREALFNSQEEYESWKEEHSKDKVKSADVSTVNGKNTFLGIDSGSTTTKIVIIDEDGQVVLRHYRNNNGNPVGAVTEGLTEIKKELDEKNIKINIARTAVTGYGEDLIKAAFNMDEGIVETMAHYRGAKAFDKDVSFILDIGGQDMKAIFIKDGIIENIEINEACSSGCGSFIETFARGMGYKVADFANIACESASPCDLGSRCTVFMNSKVKQSLREGSSVADISAGLAKSVTLNCFTKVLKITDTSILGEHIVVQGGTFKNAAVLRSVEKFLNKKVIRPDISELMGAYGCALLALDTYNTKEEDTTFIGLDNLQEANDYERKQLTCKGCENLCTVTRLKFKDNKSFYTGNKCERIFTNKGNKERNYGMDITQKKLSLLFDRPLAPASDEIKGTIGIPRVLNMYQNFPFWATILVECGYRVQLSSPSSMAIAEKGSGTVMSDNICFPAKIANGHIYDLIESKVDRIFYPSVVLEKAEEDGSVNSYNCPVVTGYPDVIDSSISPLTKYGIPFDAPTISFLNEDLLYKGCKAYFVKGLGIDKKDFDRAFKLALQEQIRVKNELKEEGKKIIEHAKETQTPTILIVSRPYHIDPLINHKIPETIASFGINVLTEDGLDIDESLADVQVLTQWSYPNKMFKAALWACKQKDMKLEVVQINSFGCGPDATTSDEIKSILNAYGKSPTLVKVDEISSPGSIRLRIRSMIESMKMKGDFIPNEKSTRTIIKRYEKNDRRAILVPKFGQFYDPMILTLLQRSGYDTIPLPEPDIESVELGLRYANQDICYPATIVIGDIIKAVLSGKYDPKNIAAGITQTGGQCRASNYASLIKRGLINAGYADVPVVTVGLTMINDQPGFKLSKIDMMKEGIVGMPYADAISTMYYYCAAREVKKGESLALANKYIALHPKDFALKATDKLLKQAVAEFNAIETHDLDLPKAGLVGEIYVKYNSFANGDVCDWLMSKGVEVIVPPVFDFFVQKVISEQVNKETNARDVSFLGYYGSKLSEKVIDVRVDSINQIMSKFKGFRPIHHIRQIAENAAKVTAMTNQFGEAWLLPGEIASFAEEGINNVLCLQPFGCIANHIIARGIETRLKTRYPELNLLYLDMDAGASEVNTVNRLEFFVRSAKDSMVSVKEEKEVMETVASYNK
ncbi:acyl-CoA dehydratase activase-related protein [Brachyspira pulli]|uniref:acyl-CoA dehydratase activase-related protein n=1 Tax=Brachyspira pulli TaxID=310721 RepID=UPI003003D914